MIRARGSREASVHVRRNRLYLINSNIGWKNSVESINEVVNGGVIVKVCYHVASMHSSISAPCTHYVDRLAEQGRDTAFYLALHADAIGLNLPSVVACAIVCQMNEVTHKFLYLLGIFGGR